MGYNLFLDDIRAPSDSFYYTKDKKYTELKWMIVKSHKEFINVIDENGLPDLISFDHDLSEEKTGYDCAKWLYDYCLENNKQFPEYLIHSWNIVGTKNIKHYIENFKKHNKNERI